MVADDLGVHGAGIERALRRRFWRGLVAAEIGGRICLELGLAAGRAEIEFLALTLQEMARGGAIDRHTADGVLGREVAFRRSLELCAAAIAAEMEGAAMIIQRRLARFRIYGHATDGIADHLVLSFGVIMTVGGVTMMAVIVLVVRCHIMLLCPRGVG